MLDHCTTEKMVTWRTGCGLRASRIGVWLGLLFALAALAQEAPPAATLAELQQRLGALVNQPQFAAALWGVKVVSLDTGQVLFEHNAKKLFSPASNSKLYTVALALDRLGADYRIRTSLNARAKPNHRGTLKGDLIVYGRGDPSFNARLHGGDVFQALEPLVAALTNAGVKRITGDLVGDASFLRGPEFGSGWDWDDLEAYYGAEISALTINDNALPVMVKPGEKVGDPCRLLLTPATCYLTLSNRTETVAKGSRRSIRFYRPITGNLVYVSGTMPADDPGYTEDVTLHNPAGLFIALFQEALARHGVKVRGRLRTVDWLKRAPPRLVAAGDGPGGPESPAAPPLATDERSPAGALVELGFVESPPMRELAREVEKPSQNLYADLLLAQVGEHTRTGQTRADATSEDLGIAELNRFLNQAGVAKGDVLFEEGSGLSRNNLTTPAATVALLQYMSRHPCAAAYAEALPIAGVDGTLRNRMKGTVAANNLRGKTGTLRWANSLSGYVTTAAGERLAFSFMLNRYHNPGSSARADLDALAVMLAGFTGRSG